MLSWVPPAALVPDWELGQEVANPPEKVMKSVALLRTLPIHKDEDTRRV